MSELFVVFPNSSELGPSEMFARVLDEAALRLSIHICSMIELYLVLHFGCYL